MNYKRIAQIMIEVHRAKSIKEVEELNRELKKIDFENRKMDIVEKVLDKYRRKIKEED